MPSTSSSRSVFNAVGGTLILRSLARSLGPFAPFLPLALLLCFGCASVKSSPAVATIPASDMRQVCIELSPNDILDFFYDSSGPLTFEILYTEGGDTFYSYSQNNSYSDRGRFYPEKQQFYCLTWLNHNTEPASLRYEYLVTRPEK